MARNPAFPLLSNVSNGKIVAFKFVTNQDQYDADGYTAVPTNSVASITHVGDLEDGYYTCLFEDTVPNVIFATADIASDSEDTTARAIVRAFNGTGVAVQVQTDDGTDAEVDDATISVLCIVKDDTQTR